MDPYVNQAQDYIRQQLAVGFTVDAIANQLRAAGWQEEVLQQAFATLQTPPTVATPQQYVQSASQPLYHQEAPRTKASFNPFMHIFSGFKNFIQTNFLSGFLVMLTLFVGYLVLFAALAGIVIALLLGGLGGSSPAGFIGGLIFLLLLSLFMQMLCGQAFTRTVLTGARRQKISFKDAYSVSLHRLVLTLLCYLALIGTYVGAFVLVIIASQLFAPLGIALGVIAIVSGILLALYVLHLQLVLVDDTKPLGIKDAFKRSMNIWNHSRVATILFVLVGIAVYVGLALLSGGSDNSSSWTDAAASDGNDNTGSIMAVIGAIIVGIGFAAFIYTVILALILAGLAHIYNEVRGDPNQLSEANRS